MNAEETFILPLFNSEKEQVRQNRELERETMWNAFYQVVKLHTIGHGSAALAKHLYEVKESLVNGAEATDEIRTDFHFLLEDKIEHIPVDLAIGWYAFLRWLE